MWHTLETILLQGIPFDVALAQSSVRNLVIDLRNASFGPLHVEGIVESATSSERKQTSYMDPSYQGPKTVWTRVPRFHNGRVIRFPNGGIPRFPKDGAPSFPGWGENNKQRHLSADLTVTQTRDIAYSTISLDINL